MDSKGRIVIPEDVRKELGLNEGSRVTVTLEKSSVNSGTVVILTKGVGPDEFIKRTKGALKKQSRAKAADPLRLKEIWGGPGRSTSTPTIGYTGWIRGSRSTGT